MKELDLCYRSIKSLYVLLSCLTLEILFLLIFVGNGLLDLGHCGGVLLFPHLALQSGNLLLKRFFFRSPLLLPSRVLILGLLEFGPESLDLLSVSLL